MVSFVVYDLIFMSLFILFVIFFLSTRKHNLKRQGWMFMYRTQFGVQFIDKIAIKYKNILRPMRYLVLACGYALMATMIWMMIKTTEIYLTTSISSFVRAPPIAPLIPYFPKVFGLESFFPPLYFTYFIIALAIVIFSHEGAHGIFARLEKFKVHSTGLVFLGPIPGAFVEPDEKEMQKAKIFPQLSVLGAGTFANVIMTIIFGAIMLLFFSSAFVANGVVFNSYASSPVMANQMNVLENSNVEGFLQLEFNGTTYYSDEETINYVRENEAEAFLAYDDAPAIKSGIPQGAAIVEIDGEKIENREKLTEVLGKYSPGETVNVKIATMEAGQGTTKDVRDYQVELGEKDGRAFLGVGFSQTGGSGIMGWFYQNTIAKVKEPNVYYISEIGNFGWFVYYLLWWIVMINIAVALFNMLPLGILDGGRFFYLTVVAITKKEKIGMWAYRIATGFLILLLAAMMIKWAFAFF